MMMNVVDTLSTVYRQNQNAGKVTEGQVSTLHSDGREGNGEISPERRPFRTASMSKSKEDY